MKQHKYLHISLRYKLSSTIAGRVTLNSVNTLWYGLGGILWDKAVYTTISAAKMLIAYP